MTTLLEDWRAYCCGEAAFDKSHFMGLLKSHNGADELREIFSYVPNSDALMEIAVAVISGGNLSTYLLPGERGEKGHLIYLGGRWLREMERASRMLGDYEIADICRDASIELVDDERLWEVLFEDNPNSWFFDLISDAVIENMTIDSGVVYALLEAFYGIAADYYVAWYMASPLINLDIDFSLYYDFWVKGGRCALTEGVMYINGLSR